MYIYIYIYKTFHFVRGGNMRTKCRLQTQHERDAKDGDALHQWFKPSQSRPCDAIPLINSPYRLFLYNRILESTSGGCFES